MSEPPPGEGREEAREGSKAATEKADVSVQAFPTSEREEVIRAKLQVSIDYVTELRDLLSLVSSAAVADIQ